MEKITGRTDDMIILRGVNLFPTQIEELILRTPALSPHFQCVLTRPGRLDELTVRVEAHGRVARPPAPPPGWSSGSWSRASSACRCAWTSSSRTASSGRSARCAASWTSAPSREYPLQHTPVWVGGY